jgi:hypothetical protein
MTAVAGIVALAVGFVPGPASASETGSLPSVTSGERPGPDLLYAPAPLAPQLQNTGPWRAKPIMVSGASSYRSGEFVYQDYLYDDYGNSGLSASNTTSAYSSASSKGVLKYPTDPVFANNAADLVEFRAKPLSTETAFRVTLNSLVDPERSAFTIAIGGTPDRLVTWPAKAGTRSPADFFLTVHGSTATLTTAAGVVVSPAPSVSVDVGRRQFDVRVPHASWKPGRSTVRLAVGVGLWDVAAAQYLQPQNAATSTSPGGKKVFGGGALFNVAFRSGETGGWRDDLQAQALDSQNVSTLSAAVDFGKLTDGVADDSGVPTTGVINRIYASRFDTGQGIDYTKSCGRSADVQAAGGCEGILRGQLQPYRVEIPDQARPPAGYSLTFLMHALGMNHNMFALDKYSSQLADDGAGSLVVTPSGRGPDGDYRDLAEADMFEVWADVARQYALAPGRTTISGYSMGAGATYTQMMRWPDLFARGAAFAAVPDPTGLPSLRNNPVNVWIGTLDEGTSMARQAVAEKALRENGYRFQFNTFLTEHLLIALQDFSSMAQWLGDYEVNQDPRRVTYVVDPTFDSALAGLKTDHAFWLSDLAPRSGSTVGQVDATSDAFGTAEPEKVTSGGVRWLDGTNLLPYTRSQQDWLAPESTSEDNTIRVDVKNLASVTVDGARARLNCTTPLTVVVSSDGDARLRIDMPLTRTVVIRDSAGRSVPSQDRTQNSVTLPVVAGNQTLTVTCR